MCLPARFWGTPLITHTKAEKMEVINLAPTPKNQQELHSFLGLVHYYGKFIANLATPLHPLNELVMARYL